MQRKGNVFRDILKYIPRNNFDKTVDKYDGNKWSKKFKYWDLFLVLLHGQLSGEMSLRMVGLSHNARVSLANKAMPRSTLSDCCMKKKPEVLMDVFWQLVDKLEGQGKKLIKRLASAIQLIDSTGIMLMDKGYEWAKGNGRIKGLKMHTVYDNELKCPVHFSITSANVNDIEEAKKLPIKKHKIYVFDKGYCDFLWWNKINEQESYFVSRLKKGVRYVIERQSEINSANIRCDQTINLTARNGKQYKSLLRYVEVEIENGKTIILLSNDFNSTAETIAELYKTRWKIELFFKCIKQNLKIKRFWGKSENAVKLQIIVAMITYALLRLVQVASLSTYTLKEVGVLIRINMGSTLPMKKILKIPVNVRSPGISRRAKL
jgi:putative transposase